MARPRPFSRLTYPHSRPPGHPLIIILWVAGRGSGWLGDSMNIENGLARFRNISTETLGRVASNLGAGGSSHDTSRFYH